jgi:DNA-directed RNA polymerase specialized sigma24 family protein
MDIIDQKFDNLLLKLEPDFPDSASRYKRFRSKIVKFFEWKRCEDAEELADETITRALNNLFSGTEILADSPYAYIYAIAANVYREYIRKQIRKETLLRKAKERIVTAEQVQDCRTQCLQRLAESKSKLLQRYYLDPEDREAIAAELNLTLNALRLQIHRLKKELKDCYEECIRNLSES